MSGEASQAELPFLGFHYSWPERPLFKISRPQWTEPFALKAFTKNVRICDVFHLERAPLHSCPLFQSSMRAEMEVAMKLLEKDIHEKQDTIVSLRRQLEDIKRINLDMYKKLQVSSYQISPD